MAPIRKCWLPEHSGLSLDSTSADTGPHGGKVTMTVNGTPTAITPGASYAGAIVIDP